MAFFDGISKKISQTSQDVVKKTKNFADSTKLSGMINEEERGIQELYRRIGEQYCLLHLEDAEETLAALVGQVVQARERIEQYNQQIAQINGVQKCPGCGAEVPDNALFCNACGTKMPPKPVAAPAADVVVCANCGNQLPAGQKFCSKCGSPIQSPEKTCPNCGKTLPADAAFCTGCGSMV